jgi:C-terminal processing protease CtpA/Prc
MIGAALVAVVLVVAGVWWHKASQPKPVVKPPLTIVGVGLYLGRDQATHKFVVRKVFPNSPAEKAGIVPGLVLNKVGDVFAETKNIKELSALLMGPEGSTVTVEMLNTNDSATTNLELIRKKFVNRSAPSTR